MVRSVTTSAILCKLLPLEYFIIYCTKMCQHLMFRLSRSLFFQLINRAFIHGDSFVTIDGSVVSNAVFLSQQLQSWLCLLQNEFGPQFVAAATATAKFQPSLKWNAEAIQNQLSALTKKSDKLICLIINVHLTSCFPLQSFVFIDWHRLAIM